MKKVVLFAFIFLFAFYTLGQSQEINQDERKVPDFVLPELLINRNGQKITTVTEWEQQRRPELINLFAKHMYGESFSLTASEIYRTHKIVAEDSNSINGKAIRKQVRLFFRSGTIEREALLLIYLPKTTTTAKVPAFLAYNFDGNHSVSTDPQIIISSSIGNVSDDDLSGKRGSQSTRWPIEKIIDSGFGVVTLCYHDIYPDKEGMKEKSFLRLSDNYEEFKDDIHSEQAIGTWAWGLSLVLDYLIANEVQIDKDRIAVMGHSRQGKAALWAGANDQRFAIVISNNSGCGGAALSKRKFGENIAAITSYFPHWFCKDFNRYAGKEEDLPFDQHELIALMAPRPVYIASAQEDLWADPKGEFLAGVYATPAYNLYGLEGINTTTMPEVNKPVMHHIGYHIRSGIHDVTDFDWDCYIAFAKKHFKIN